MYRPLTEDEKRSALRDGVNATLAEAQRREPELRQVRETAKQMFAALLKAPTLQIVQAPVPHGVTPPTGEMWSVTTKVTVQE